MREEVSILIDRLCEVFEIESLGDDAAPEMMRIIRAVSYDKIVVIEANGRMHLTLCKHFGYRDPLWKVVTTRPHD